MKLSKRANLPSDATVASVVPTLNKADAYVAGVFHHMHECRRDTGAAYVRIGVMGKGKIPHYRVEYDVPDVVYPVPIYGAFQGVNHKKLVDEDLLRDEHWSTERMTYEALKETLGQVRNFKKKNSHA